MKKVIKSTALLILLGFVIAIILTFLVNTHGEVEGVAVILEDWKDNLRVVRWTFVTALIVFWDEFCEVLNRAKGFDEQLAWSMSLRWRVLVSLVAFDLIVIEAVPMKVFGV